MKKLQKRLDALLAEWQPRLRLADWEVNLSARRERDMPSPGENNLGACRTALPRRIATMLILDPQDALFRDPSELEAELEDTLIHELIHLHFAPFMDTDPKSPTHIAQEQAIDALARAFVDTKKHYSAKGARRRK